jgi:spore germination protein GerM
MGQMVESGRSRSSLPRCSTPLFRPHWRAASLLLVALLVLAACSGPGDDDDSADDSTATIPVATATSPAGEATATSPDTGTEPTATTGMATEPAATATSDTPPPTATTGAVATATAPAGTPNADDTLVLSVYYVRDEKVATAHREIPRTQQVGAAAMEELLAGPTTDEADAGLSTSIPEGTEFLGLTIEDGVGTVDLSGEYESGGGSLSMQLRLAQVVYTLTQFPTIETVNFMLDGEPVEVFGGEGLILDRPVGRADMEEATPLIFVESPAPWDTVSSPLQIHGTANTFEAVFQLQVLDADGNLLIDEPVMATSGTGTRGTFDITVEFDAETDEGTVRVFEYSARDGSEVNIVEIPVLFE